jgi:hypothetical protein
MKNPVFFSARYGHRQEEDGLFFPIDFLID